MSYVILQDILLQSAKLEPINTSQVILMKYITLFASAPGQKQYCLRGETLGKGETLDLGCTKTVSGEL